LPGLDLSRGSLFGSRAVASPDISVALDGELLAFSNQWVALLSRGGLSRLGRRRLLLRRCLLCRRLLF
jgi:hypothetical protein